MEPQVSRFQYAHVQRTMKHTMRAENKMGRKMPIAGETPMVAVSRFGERAVGGEVLRRARGREIEEGGDGEGVDAVKELQRSSAVAGRFCYLVPISGNCVIGLHTYAPVACITANGRVLLPAAFLGAPASRIPARAARRGRTQKLAPRVRTETRSGEVSTRTSLPNETERKNPCWRW